MGTKLAFILLLTFPLVHSWCVENKGDLPVNVKDITAPRCLVDHWFGFGIAGCYERLNIKPNAKENCCPYFEWSCVHEGPYKNDFHEGATVLIWHESRNKAKLSCTVDVDARATVEVRAIMNTTGSYISCVTSRGKSYTRETAALHKQTGADPRGPIRMITKKSLTFVPKTQDSNNNENPNQNPNPNAGRSRDENEGRAIL